MPLAFFALAWLLVMTGINGNYSAVGQQFQTDVIGTGSGGFLNFLVGLIGIAVFFRLIGMPNAGKVFMSLVILVFLMKNANVLTALQSIGSGATAAATPAGQGSTPANTAALGAAASIPTTGVTQ